MASSPSRNCSTSSTCPELNFLNQTSLVKRTTSLGRIRVHRTCLYARARDIYMSCKFQTTRTSRIRLFTRISPTSRMKNTPQDRQDNQRSSLTNRGWIRIRNKETDSRFTGSGNYIEKWKGFVEVRGVGFEPTNPYGTGS